MTHKQKIAYMRVALSIMNIGLREIDVDKIVTIYESVVETEGNLNIRDIVKIDQEVKKQYEKKEEGPKDLFFDEEKNS